MRAADAELEAASAGVDATDKLEEMAEEVIRQDRNKSPVEEAPPPPKKVQKDRIKTRQKSLQNNGLLKITSTLVSYQNESSSSK